MISHAAFKRRRMESGLLNLSQMVVMKVVIAWMIKGSASIRPSMSAIVISSAALTSTTMFSGVKSPSEIV